MKFPKELQEMLDKGEALMPIENFDEFKVINEAWLKKGFEHISGGMSYDEFVKFQYQWAESNKNLERTSSGYMGSGGDKQPYYSYLFNLINDIQLLTGNDENFHKNYNDWQRTLAIFQKTDYELIKKLYNTIVDMQIYNAKKSITKIESFLKESEVLKTLTKAQADEIKRLLSFLKYQPYYEVYRNIRAELDKKNRLSYKDEKDFYYSKFAYIDFHLTEFAFFVLAYNNRDNFHFIELFPDIDNLESLQEYALKFYDSYNDWINKQNKKKEFTPK